MTIGNTPFMQHVSTRALTHNTTSNAAILVMIFITFTGTYNSYETLNLTGFCQLCPNRVSPLNGLGKLLALFDSIILGEPSVKLVLELLLLLLASFDKNMTHHPVLPYQLQQPNRIVDQPILICMADSLYFLLKCFFEESRIVCRNFILRAYIRTALSPAVLCGLDGHFLNHCCHNIFEHTIKPACQRLSYSIGYLISTPCLRVQTPSRRFELLEFIF